MEKERIYKWGSLSAFIGALLLTIGFLLRTNIEKEYIDEFASFKSLTSTVLVAVGILLLICGLPIILYRQIKPSGKSGIIASGIAFIGIAAFHLGTLALYFALPVLVTHNAATRSLIYSDEPPFPYFALFWATSLLFQSTAFIWLGFKSIKNSQLPVWLPLLWMIGAILFILAPVIYFPLIKPANTLIMISIMVLAFRELKKQNTNSNFQGNKKNLPLYI